MDRLLHGHKLAASATQSRSSIVTIIETELDALAQKRVGYRQGGGAASTSVILGQGSVGLPAPTVSGAPTLVTDTDGSWINYATGTALDAIAGHNFGSHTDLRLDTQTDLFFLMKTGPAATDVTDVRILVGARSVVLSASVGDADPGSIDSLLFRYSTSAGDTTFKTKSRASDGVGGNETVKDTGVPIALDTIYVFRIDGRDAANVKYYINGVLVSTHTSSDFLPTATIGMSGQWKIHNLSAGTARNMKWKKYYQISN